MKSLLDAIWNQFKPPQTFSWQTLVLLSFLSWGLSLLVETIAARWFLEVMGQVFLVLGTGWGLWGSRINLLGWKIRPSPWVTSALICLFLSWWQTDRWQDFFDPAQPLNIGALRTTLLLWPLIAGAIAILPYCLPKLNPRLPDPALRPDLFTFALTTLLISLWLNFYFLLQGWLQNYPSLMADDFSQSGFVVKIDTPNQPTVMGDNALQQMKTNIEQTLGNRGWSEVERWLLNLETEVRNLQRQILGDPDDPASLPEIQLWEFHGDVSQQQRIDEYVVELEALWNGPSSQPNGYQYKTTCRVQQKLAPASTQATVDPLEPTANVECDPGNDRMWRDQTQEELSPNPPNPAPPIPNEGGTVG